MLILILLETVGRLFSRKVSGQTLFLHKIVGKNRSIEKFANVSSEMLILILLKTVGTTFSGKVSGQTLFA